MGCLVFIVLKLSGATAVSWWWLLLIFLLEGVRIETKD